MVTTVKCAVDITRLPVNEETHIFEGWTVEFRKSHILHSKCSNSAKKCEENSNNKCLFCRFSHELNLPHLPDMVFANNVLRVTHPSGCSIYFTALDALKRVRNGQLNLKIACADAWKESRQETGLVDRQVQPFDWTFSTDYPGSLEGPWNSEETQLRIDLERLKQKEKILFYHDLSLFEDELHDNGVASCSVKIRVMPSGFFILLRFFLRVDGVMLKLNDTRMYHDFTTDYILREYTSREGKFSDLKIPVALTNDPNEIAPLLPLVNSKYEKLTITS